MKTIWKYEIPFKNEFTLQMPKGAELISVANQNEMGCLWAFVDPNEDIEDVNFCLYGTGYEIENPNILSYLGSFQQYNGRFVWHLFEEGEYNGKA